MLLVLMNDQVVGSIVDAGLYLSTLMYGYRSVSSLTLPEAMATLLAQGYSVKVIA